MKRERNSDNSDEVKLFPTSNDLPEERRRELCVLINQQLADVIDLKMQLKQAHWNVKGPSFIGLHKLFDEIHEEVAEYMDMIAERAVQLGGVAEGTVRAAATRTHLEEYPDVTDGMSHAAAVANAIGHCGHNIRMAIDEAEALSDADTSDMFTEISRGLDKWLWFVEAHCQANS